MPVAMTSGGSRYYFAYDQVGSLRLVTDSSGAVVKRIDYDTFGNILDDSNAGFTVPFGFTGGLHDRDTGLVRFGYRDYMPEIGRWTAKDPILFAGGDSNLYGYVGNDPVNFVDPTGEILVTGTLTVVAGAIYAGEAAIGLAAGIILGGVISDQLDWTDGIAPPVDLDDTYREIRQPEPPPKYGDQPNHCVVACVRCFSEDTCWWERTPSCIYCSICTLGGGFNMSEL